MKPPLVSVIVTTLNNTTTLDACLRSITAQTYENFELVVVDNNSTDDTLAIARKYTPHVYTKGPERSAQRNYAVEVSKGKYIFIIDSDMELTKNVVKSCVNCIESDPEVKAVIIPEESFGIGFWAQVKKLERSFYVGQDAIEAARFFPKDLYQEIGGYDEKIVGGEDWHLTDRIREYGRIGRVNQYIMHNEGHFTLRTAIRKKFYYVQGFMTFFDDAEKKQSNRKSPASSALYYYKLYLSKPFKLFKNPFYGVGVLVLKTAEFAAAALGLVAAKLKKTKPTNA
jgi:glycosyltransferase involved in cell wall biosynthesis